MIGTKLAHYEITSHLGAGGMGEVYQATDSKLGRSVAIKLLPEEFTHNADRAARFEREARVLASLNHPNIAVIHGIEESGGRKFLVMELVDGETLAERIKRGPIPINEALEIAKQIAEALEAAHESEKAIIHRDLKPANVKITPDGKVKVLDFGLAKAYESQSANVNLSNSPTLNTVATMQGVILGTAAYMSPEQAKSKTVDRRADIWAFGAVVYEMLTGRTVFSAETASETMAAVIMKEPDWDALPKNTLSRLRALLRRCLVNEPRNRLRDIGDARLAIEEMIAHPEADADQVVIGASMPSRRWVRERLAWGAAVAVLLIGGSMAWYAEYFRPASKRDIGAVRFSVLPPDKGTWGTGPSAPFVSISPDGRSVAFVTQSGTNGRIWVRSIDSLEPRPLIDGVTTGGATPFWSPDSQWIGFFADGKLKKIEAAGGLAQTLCDAARGRGGTWNRDGVIVFDGGPTESLQRVSSAGGKPEALTTLDSSRQEQRHSWPYFLPDGDHFLFLALNSTAEKNAIFTASLSSKERKLIVNANSRMAYDNAAGIIFVRDGTLMALPFDTAKLQVQGEALPIAENVGYNPQGGAASLSVSENGVLAYRAGTTFSERQLTWFDRSGKVLGTVGKPGLYLAPKLSPDEKRLAIQRIDRQTQNRDIWVLEMARDVMTRLTFGPSFDEYPVWSPNGDQIAFRSTRNGIDNIYVKPSRGGGGEESLFEAYFAWDWAADGRFILYGPQSGQELSVLPLFGDRKSFTYLPRSSFGKFSAQFSSDGRWTAYASNESGQYEVYIQTFPNSSGKYQISTNTGYAPRWRRDGKEIFYVAADGKLMAVALRSAGTVLEVSKPIALFNVPVFPVVQWPQYDVTGDGQRFLVNSVGEADDATPITVIVNWLEELKQRVPVK